MLDVILDSLGVALFLGQALYFCIVAEASIGASGGEADRI
jgi:hypothetical protein